ncbi:MAG TPA: hemolysin family protein [Thermomicrobiales bacterium]|jgi:putative hemolysin
MSGAGTQLLVLLLLLVANGVFAMAELSIASARKVRLQQRAAEGDSGARTALELAEDPGRFLSTVQIGITLIGILTGTFGGASLGAVFGQWLSHVPLLGQVATPLGIGLAIAIITYLSLIIGELVPKQLALGNAEGIAARVSRPMRTLSRLASPLVWLLSQSTALVVRLLGVRPSTEPAVTEEEITIMVQEGAQAGVFQAAEREIVDRVFRLGDQRVSDLMVPRPRVIWINAHNSDEENLRLMAESGYTHYPVCDGDLDHVLGLVSVQELWQHSVTGQPKTIREVMRTPLFLPETTAAYKALEQFKAANLWFALVLDEYGGIEGLITLGDLMGDLVGDAIATTNARNIVQRDDGSWLVEGMLPLDELRETLPIGDMPGEEQGYFQTLGGFVLAELGRLPQAGDKVEQNGFAFEVMDMDGNRVDKVLVTAHSGEGK